MRIRSSVATALLLAGIIQSCGQLVLAESEHLEEGDTRPDYHGPYRYPRESANPYPLGPYPYPNAITTCLQPDCQGAYGNTYYQYGRDGTSYVGHGGVPDSIGNADEHRWRVPRRLRAEANNEDYHRDDYHGDYRGR